MSDGKRGRLLLMALLLGLCRCGQRDTYQAVVVTVDESGLGTLGAEIETLQAAASLNGNQAKSGVISVAPKMVPFTLLVPVDLSGQLMVSVNGLNTMNDAVAQGTGTVGLTGTGEYALTVVLNPGAR